MNVLSLFDGMSCGQIALERAGIKVDNYFASEIDKHAIQVTQKNYPKTIQLGDVTKVSGKDLPNIDLLIGGSPCQGFSFAGKGMNFDDPRSRLFFEFVRLKEEINPRYWMLENVMMKKEYEKVITEYLGADPVLINSSLVSAQNRKRLYWTNIPVLCQPSDLNINIKDIIENIPFNYEKDKYRYIPRDPKKESLCIHIGTACFKGGDKLKRVYHINGKAPTLTTISGGCQQKKISNTDLTRWRELSPIEYERLQTVPDNYTSGVKNTARYTMLGNGWTVDVIAHIFKGIRA